MAAYYPPVGFHFKVEFPGIGSGDKDIRFQEVTGLTAEMSMEELPVGGENKFSYRLPTRARYSNMILKRGMLNDSGLITWFRDAIENFEFRPIDVNVHLLNEKHEVMTAWKVLHAYPVKWSISNFNSTGNALVIETIELAYQYFQRQVNSFGFELSLNLGLNVGFSASLNVGASISAGASLDLGASASLSAGVDLSADVEVDASASFSLGL